MAAFPLTAPWRLTLPEGLYDELHAHLYPGDGDEHGAVITAGIAQLSDGSIRLLARDLFLAQDGRDYVQGKRGHRMLKAEFIGDRIRFCSDEKLAYLAIHNHGGGDSVEFSGTDLQSHERGYPALLDIVDGTPVGALVFASNAVAGDIWLPGGGRVGLEGVVITGRRRRVLTPHPIQRKFIVDGSYDRQVRLFGERGQDVLRHAKVGIIGLGGVGILLAEYLGSLGVGRLVLIDPQRVDVTNLPRMPTATRWDAKTFLRGDHLPGWIRKFADPLSTPKVEIAKRAIRRANRYSQIDAVQDDFLHPDVAARVLDCDYLFLAADSMRARLLFNQIVHQYLIPGVQIGSKVSTDASTGDVDSVFSIVRPVTPEVGCLWCNQIINPGKLQEEALAEGERRANRYIDDPDVIAPSVITLNAVGAAHAANDFLLYMTGLMEPDAPQGYLRHMARIRETRLVTPRRDDACPECGHASHSRLARGDGVRLFTRA